MLRLKRWIHKMAKAKKRYLGKLFSFKVYEVDPESLEDIDATWEDEEHAFWGVHGYLLASYVPKTEIWVNKNISSRNKILAVGHEFVEACLMREGVPYQIAHWAAEAAQKEFYRYIASTLKLGK